MGIIIPIMGIILIPKGATQEAGGLADALFGRVRQRVLGLLFGHPDRSFYANEIIRWVGSGSGAVQRELARLEAAGLVTASRIGRQKHYRANEGAPIFPELRGIVLKTSGLKDVLHDGLAPLQNEIRVAFVFGSIAKGTVTAGSDVDLMVISERLTYAELFDAIEAASSRLARPVNPTIYTPTEFSQRVRDGNPFLARVLQQPKVWIIGGNDDLPT
jgi:predicted nucleotidyltransferase